MRILEPSSNSRFPVVRCCESEVPSWMECLKSDSVDHGVIMPMRKSRALKTLHPPAKLPQIQTALPERTGPDYSRPPTTNSQHSSFDPPCYTAILAINYRNILMGWRPRCR